MGWNAGGYGSMTFPSIASLDAWRRHRVSHRAWSDWIGELQRTRAPDEKVPARLARIAKGQRPSTLPIQEIRLDGLSAHLTYETDEEDFREGAGDIAAVLRAAGEHGAEGRFFFLGTAGAERAFAYELVLTGEGSTLRALAGKAMTRAYGDAYRRFQERASSLLEAANPDVRAIMTAFREGERASGEGATAHARVMEGLADLGDAELCESARRYPHAIPDGTGPRPAKKVFTPANVRASLADATHEPMRGVALWVLGERAPDVAVPLALEALASKTSSEPVRCAALRVLRHVRADRFDEAFAQVADTFRAQTSVLEVRAAYEVLLSLDHPRLSARVGALIVQLAEAGPEKLWGLSPTSFLFTAIDKRKMTPAVAVPLARFAVSNAVGHLRQQALRMAQKTKNREALAILAAAEG